MFDDSRLDDAQALARADQALRWIAESGARVRREATEAAASVAQAVDRFRDTPPRAVVAAGPDSRLLRAVLEPWCPVPFVAWPHPRLPGWAGGLDLVVVLAPQGSDEAAASGVAEAVRRGCQVIVAAPPGSLVAEHAVGRDAVVLPSHTQDPLATAVMVLELLHGLALAPQVGSDAVADALDDVAVACSPFRDASVNPAKSLATGIADTSPLLWGASVLAARAARRVAESVRRTTGRAALAADAEHLFPVLESTPTHDVFADPFADPESAPRPSLVVFDDGFEEPQLRATRSALLATAERRGVRVETVTSQADGEVARYAALLATGQFAATYLGLGFAD
ncbi:MAG TPA: SIS domain-containing protein [Marmoricola sp.]|nr:SIS domain-containing protein [Marmoricola sp.]